MSATIKIAALETALEQLTTKFNDLLARVEKLETAPKATKPATRTKQEKPHPYPTTYSDYIDILTERLTTFQVADISARMPNDKFICNYGVYLLPKLVFDYMTQIKEHGTKFGYINPTYEATLEKMYAEFSKYQFDNFNNDETLNTIVRAFNTELKYVGDHLRTNKPKKGEAPTECQKIAATIKDAYKPLYQAFKKLIPVAESAENVARPELDP